VTNNPEMEEESKRRLTICTPCDSNSSKNTISKLSTCKACGCILVAKSFSSGSKCPKGYWENGK
jgi:ribosomal protein L37AE/L43A